MGLLELNWTGFYSLFFLYTYIFFGGVRGLGKPLHRVCEQWMPYRRALSLITPQCLWYWTARADDV